MPNSMSSRPDARLLRAAAQVPIKRANAFASRHLHGYWINGDRFFHVVDFFDKDGRHLFEPRIFHADRQDTKTLIAAEDLEALSHAAFGRSAKEAFGGVVDLDDRESMILRYSQRSFRIVSNPLALEDLGETPSQRAFAPDGRYTIVLDGENLAFEDRRSGKTSRLTNDGAPYFAYGRQPESAIGALAARAAPQPAGIWSPDSCWFATLRADERNIPEVTLVQHFPGPGEKPRCHSFKYSIAGEPCAEIEFILFHVPSGRRINTAEYPIISTASSPFFLGHGWFSADAKLFFFLRFDRYVRTVELVEVDLSTGVSRVILTDETKAGYLDFSQNIVGQPNIRCLCASAEIIWYSERDGWAHLYLYDRASGDLKNQITTGNYLVRDIVHVDETARRIFFTAGAVDPDDDPARRSLCSIGFGGEDFRVEYSGCGDIAVSQQPLMRLDHGNPHSSAYRSSGAAPGGQHVIIRDSGVRDPARTIAFDLASKRAFELALMHEQPGSVSPEPERFTAFAADGQTRLHGAIFRPADFHPGKSYPLVDFIYPGPQTSYRPREYQSIMAGQAQAIAELGCVVAMFDSRGLPLQSRNFHHAGYGSLAEPQLEDHVAVLRQLLSSRPYLDGARVGIFGQSGGGYAAARALLAYPEFFHVGVAVCGNHDPDRYCSYWTDKYVGTARSDDAPLDNLALAGGLRGKLLLVSGDMDDNVHVSHTIALAGEIQRHRRWVDLMIVPNEGHFLLMTNPAVQERVWCYFNEHLIREGCIYTETLNYSQSELLHFQRMFTLEALS